MPPHVPPINLGFAASVAGQPLQAQISTFSQNFSSNLSISQQQLLQSEYKFQQRTVASELQISRDPRSVPFSPRVVYESNSTAAINKAPIRYDAEQMNLIKRSVAQEPQFDSAQTQRSLLYRSENAIGSLTSSRVYSELGSKSSAKSIRDSNWYDHSFNKNFTKSPVKIIQETVFTTLPISTTSAAQQANHNPNFNRPAAPVAP